MDRRGFFKRIAACGLLPLNKAKTPKPVDSVQVEGPDGTMMNFGGPVVDGVMHVDTRTVTYSEPKDMG